MPSITTAFFVTLIFMVALRPVAINIGLVDIPGGRKKHTGDIPMVGGIAMFLGSAVGLSLLPDSHPSLAYLVVAGGLLVVIGVLDDRYGLPASIRLVTQLVSVLIMVFGADIRIIDLGDPFGSGVIFLGPVSLIFTVLVTVSIINAFNLVDGLDGLAGSMALIALIAIVPLGGYQSSMTMASLVVAASILAFLYFNFPTAQNRNMRAFMGDAGSTFVGLIVVWVMISVSQGSGAIATPVVCLWFVSMPVFDLFTCFVKRCLRRRSPFRPGRDHFHHILQRSGMGIRSVLAVLTGLQLIYAAIGITGHFAGATDVVMFAAWALVGVSQHWVIRRYAAMYRLDLRRKRARGVPVAAGYTAKTERGER